MGQILFVYLSISLCAYAHLYAALYDDLCLSACQCLLILSASTQSKYSMSYRSMTLQILFNCLPSHETHSFLASEHRQL